jgi:hypothetical protein
MDRLDISNTVDSTDAFRVAAAATANVLFCSGFLIWYLKTPVRNLATKIYCTSFLRIHFS